MMSEIAFFVKDVINPNGAVSILDADKGALSNIDGHTRMGTILVHRPTGDTRIDLANEPGHQALCDAEQTHVLHAIIADLDLSRPMQGAVQSLWICLAADESIRTGRSVSRPMTASFGLKVRLASAVQCLWGSWASCKVCPP
jgi:hypothetical protein